MSLLAPISDVVIIVDVISFSTAVEIATNRGALVYPFQWKDETAYEFARSVAAEVADKRNPNGYSLSPASLQAVPSGLRLVLASPNGSELSLLTGSIPAIAGCLRNSRAVAESAMRRGRNVAVIPAGERWEDGTLRPCLEDLAGAGSIMRYLRGTPSPEARAAMAVFESVASSLFEHLKSSSSGKEKMSRGEESDIILASDLDCSDCVPVLTDGAYRREV